MYMQMNQVLSDVPKAAGSAEKDAVKTNGLRLTGKNAVKTNGRNLSQEENNSAGGGTGGGAATGTGTATYIDGGGNKRTGVVENTYYDDMRGNYNQMYEAQVAANNAAADKAAARAAEAAEEQRRALSANYQGTNRQLYRDYMENRRTLPQQLAAQGYSGGLTESSQLRLRNSYQEGLAQNERARIGQEAEINAALAQQEYETRSAADKANAQAMQTRYANLAGLRSQQYQEERSDALQRAALLASAGDYSGYRALGYSDGELAYLSKMWSAAHPELAASQSYGHYSAAASAARPAARAVAQYLKKTRGTDAAVDYIADELAAGNILSDEADAIWKELRSRS